MARAKGRAGPCESQVLLRKAIDVRHLNRLLATRGRTPPVWPQKQRQDNPKLTLKHVRLAKRLAQKKGPAEAGPFVGLVGGINLISPRGQTVPPGLKGSSTGWSHPRHRPTGRSPILQPAVCPRRSLSPTRHRCSRR